jgi:hypothetical protein
MSKEACYMSEESWSETYTSTQYQRIDLRIAQKTYASIPAVAAAASAAGAGVASFEAAGGGGGGGGGGDGGVFVVLVCASTVTSWLAFGRCGCSLVSSFVCSSFCAVSIPLLSFSSSGAVVVACSKSVRKEACYTSKETCSEI